jgi:hypothetical protein
LPICAPSTAKPTCRFSTAWIATLANRAGDVKKLKPPLTGFRLRCGDYRVFFDLKGENTITITAVITAAKPTAEAHLTTLELKPDTRPDRHWMCAGQSPDTHRTPRPSRQFCVSLRRRRKGWCLLAICLLPCASAPIVFHILSIAGNTQERRGRPVQAARLLRRACGRSVAKSLDWPPALRTLPAEKWGHQNILHSGRFDRDGTVFDERQQNQCVYAMDALSDFSVYECNREGPRKI